MCGKRPSSGRFLLRNSLGVLYVRLWVGLVIEVFSLVVEAERLAERNGWHNETSANAYHVDARKSAVTLHRLIRRIFRHTKKTRRLSDCVGRPRDRRLNSHSQSFLFRSMLARRAFCV